MLLKHSLYTTVEKKLSKNCFLVNSRFHPLQYVPFTYVEKYYSF